MPEINDSNGGGSFSYYGSWQNFRRRNKGINNGADDRIDEPCIKSRW